MLADDFSELVRARHSVRDFLPDAIPEAVLSAILDDARHSPSWSNTRPYVLAVASGERLERLRSSYVRTFDASLGLQRKQPAGVLRALLTRRGWPDGDFKTWGRYPDDLRPRSVQIGSALYKHLGIAREDISAREAAWRRNCEFFGAPTVIWVFVHKGLLPFSAHDAGLMLQTLILAAQARGVGTCPMGVLATWRTPIDAEFDVPKPYKLITGLALGYPSAHHVNDFRAEHPPVALANPRQTGAS